MQNKIMNVNKYYWAAQKRKEKVDHGNDFNDYCQTPITNICRVLVLDPTDFTALLYLCFSKPLPDHTVPLTAQHRETRETLLIVPTFLLIVPTSCSRFLALYCLLPASSVSAYIEINLWSTSSLIVLES